MNKKVSHYYILEDNIFLSLFILKNRDSTSGGGAERGGEIESQAGTVLPAQSLTQGLQSWNHKIMTWAKTESGTHKQLRHTGTPEDLTLLTWQYPQRNLQIQYNLCQNSNGLFDVNGKADPKIHMEWQGIQIKKKIFFEKEEKLEHLHLHFLIS